MEISKLVIPTASPGTKFLPFTKTISKEMLPLLNKPLIQYLAEEALQSEINNLFIITGKGKNSLIDHFDASAQEDSSVDQREHTELLSGINKIIRLANFNYIKQTENLGIGHEILLAKNSIHKEYFAISNPDDIIVSKPTALAQLIRIARQEKASIVAVQEVPTELVSTQAIVAIKKQITPNLFQLSHIVEKPQAKDAPSSLAIVGRYVLSCKIFNSLEYLSTYASEELKLNDAVSHMMQQNERVFAFKVQGTRYDVSNPLSWIKSVISSALNDSSYGPHIQRFITELQRNDPFLYSPAKTIESNMQNL